MAVRLKNDKERIAFLEARKPEEGWNLWRGDDELGRRFWIYETEGGTGILVEERLQTMLYPKKAPRWIERNWYLITDWREPVEDQKASRTQALMFIRGLKEFKQ